MDTLEKRLLVLHNQRIQKEPDKCILELQQDSSVGYCSGYGTKICKNSPYRKQCSYAKKLDSK